MKTPRQRWAIAGGATAILLSILLGALIVGVDHGHPPVIDTAWMNVMLSIRTEVLTVPALALNYLGGGVLGIFVVPLTIIAVLLIARRPWAAGYFLVATVLGAALVQLLKHLFGRARPTEFLVHADYGSFPSGHVTNAAIMAVTLAVIFPRVWGWCAGAVYTVMMMLSRTYLGAHWLTDTIGGLLAGAGLAVLLGAIVAGPLQRESARAAERRKQRRMQSSV
ncbi:phosphatase PAP2 family protein [Glaciibacter psychrotolerans]|uniref:Undecaprenyl-diphosphatase n=1 Tax=Glaciibacter psychrotolerans TaxID=670054 RepID=A0A7Z0J731_9MICO|nr:phosphatase PAP2 family protein [Leifsonia psychrotolerans]NYJ20528.1 undecaprenyl-diphosphatase [Leifsonia psychrotolerans]